MEQKKSDKISFFNTPDIYLALIYVFSAIILELVQFLWLGWGVMPKYWLLDIALILMICGVIFIIPKMLAKQVMYILFLFLPTLINIVNITLVQVFGSVLNINMLKLGAEAATAFSFKFLNFWNILVNLTIFGLATAAIIAIPKKLKKNSQKSTKNISKYAFILAFFLIFEYLGVLGFGYSIQSFTKAASILGNDAYLYESLYISNESYKKFGTYGYYFKAAETFANKSKIKDYIQLQEDIKKLKSGQNYKFSTDKSGTLENYNVVSILLESFDTFAVNPYFTPTMWNLQTSTGTSFSKFYGKNKTNISEAIALLGNAPSEVLPKHYYDSVGLCAPNALPNLIKQDAASKNQTVKTGYYHSYLASFYGRNETHLEFGFDEILGLENIYNTIPTSNFDDRILEADCFNMVMDKILPTDVDRFYSQVTTFSSHGSYDVRVPLFKDYEDYVDEHYAEYSAWLEENGYVVPQNSTLEKELKTFLARCMDTDSFVKNLLDAIEDRGLGDNTLVVMYADHAPYYNDLGIMIKGIQKNEYYKSEQNNLPLIMWAKDLEKGSVDTFCSHYDIYPTICDLLNLPVNIEITQGQSVYAEDRADIFISFLSGMYNDVYYSDNIMDVIFVNGESAEETEAKEKFRKDAENFYIKQEFIEKVWANNLFSKMK